MNNNIYIYIYKYIYIFFLFIYLFIYMVAVVVGRAPPARPKASSGEYIPSGWSSHRPQSLTLRQAKPRPGPHRTGTRMHKPRTQLTSWSQGHADALQQREDRSSICLLLGPKGPRALVRQRRIQTH